MGRKKRKEKEGGSRGGGIGRKGANVHSVAESEEVSKKDEGKGKGKGKEKKRSVEPFL